MAETTESVTRKISNPRVEIDTSPPFESVKEAVDRFGGSGPWIPRHWLRLAADHNDNEAFDVEKMEEQAVQLERDLIEKEQETLNVLKDLEAARRFAEYLKLRLMQEVTSFMNSPYTKLDSSIPESNQNTTERLSLCPVPSSGLISLELNQAKLDLNKMSIDLDVIRGSVESLNMEMRKEKVMFERITKRQIPTSEAVSSFEECRYTSREKPDIYQKVQMECGSGNSLNLFKELTQMNSETYQFKKMTEASRYEVMRAMAEIERTKNSIKMAEMRLNAAKKMEEAAKAVEAIAFAEKSALLNGESSLDVHQPNGITLSFEEYRALIQKAQQAEEVRKIKFMEANATPGTKDTYQSEVAIVEKFEQPIENKQSREVDFDEGTHRTEVATEECYPRMMERGRVRNPETHPSNFKFRNSHPSLGHRSPQVPNGNESYVKKEKLKSSFKTTSIGSILSRKLILQDDFMVGKHVENHTERQHISLSQMLRQQSRHILHPRKPMSDGNVEKQYFIQRKKFGLFKYHYPSQARKNHSP